MTKGIIEEIDDMLDKLAMDSKSEMERTELRSLLIKLKQVKKDATEQRLKIREIGKARLLLQKVRDLSRAEPEEPDKK